STPAGTTAPAQLNPAPPAALAAEIAVLAGGAEALGRRAGVLAEAGDFRLAVHLIEWTATAAPASRALQWQREGIYARCVETQPSLIGKA
ncbi:alkyl sulfatase dimerization domain-containing protein, partial [Klebsiella pneumoniae]|uniref:alkyl sulfatase dimerization domain-containing protein n=1 Tax=Klebsiella pneumoniae TaxID=573 RepID=UPI00195340BA